MKRENFARGWMRRAEIGAVVLHSNPLYVPTCAVESAWTLKCPMGTGIFGRPDSASFHPSLVLVYQRLSQEQDLGKSWGQLQHTYGWYCLPDETVNRAQLSALMAKDSRPLTMHLVLGTLSQSLCSDTEGPNFM